MTLSDLSVLKFMYLYLRFLLILWNSVVLNLPWSLVVDRSAHLSPNSLHLQEPKTMENQCLWQFMALTSSEEYLCPCGHAFQQDSVLTKHQRTCLKTKKCLFSALERAKEVWKDKKQRRTSSTLTQCSDDLAAMQLSLPGLLPTPAVMVVADAMELFAEVRDTFNFVVSAERILRVYDIVAYGTRQYASQHDGLATMDSAN